uniref:Uncharacterized protein n=1 Tax=Timema tahoe TaxID=61484 RepID=A0A7R9FLD5_9NEOP|nr:unnamed protein product [Timema tahoe]
MTRLTSVKGLDSRVILDSTRLGTRWCVTSLNVGALLCGTPPPMTQLGALHSDQSSRDTTVPDFSSALT